MRTRRDLRLISHPRRLEAFDFSSKRVHNILLEYRNIINMRRMLHDLSLPVVYRAIYVL